MESNRDFFLVLYNSVPYFSKFLNRSNVLAKPVLRELTLPLRAARKISKWLKMPQSFWYSDWKEVLGSVDVVIVFAPSSDENVIDYIRKRNPTIRIIYWYWNPVSRVGLPGDYKNVEMWSFDPTDCRRYGMKFNTTFYFKDITLPKAKNSKIDALFVGNDKGRGVYLQELNIRLSAQSLSCYFYIIPDKRNSSRKALKVIPYSEYLSLLAETKSIIDIIPDGQTGLTLRPMESIFFQKKLITSDKTILNQPFYNKNNIFILDHDDDDRLTEFLHSPFIPVEKSVMTSYDFTNWLERFYKR